MCPWHCLPAHPVLTGTSALKKGAVDWKTQALTGSLPSAGPADGGSADHVSEDLFLSGGSWGVAVAVEVLASGLGGWASYRILCTNTGNQIIRGLRG